MKVNITKEIVELMQTLDDTNNETIVNFWMILTHCEKGDRISSAALRDELNISHNSSFVILEKLVELKLAKCFYNVYCPKCGKLIKTVDVFNRIPQTIKCSTCNTDSIALENAYIVYEIVDDVWNKPQPGTVELGAL